MQIQTTVPYYACIRGGKRISNGRTVGSIYYERAAEFEPNQTKNGKLV